MDGFWIDFGRVWGEFGCVLGEFGHSKSAALLAAPGVLNPTALYAGINILLFLTRGGQNIGRGRSKIRQVGSMLAHFSLLSAAWAHFSRLAAFVAPFGRFFRDLGRSSLDF